MIKVSVSRRSERWSPDGNEVEVFEHNNLEEAIKQVWILTEDQNLIVSCASDNSNIVGLGVDYDIEIQDTQLDDEGEEIEAKVFTSVEDGKKYRLYKGKYEEVKNQ